MRTLVIAALLIGLGGCGGGKGKQGPISGTSPQPPGSERAATSKKPAASFKVEMVASTSGLSMEAMLRDTANNEPMMGATVVLTSPALQGEQVNISDEQGRIAFSSLPPGDYTMTVYYSDQTTSGKFTVENGKVAKVSLEWDLSQTQGDVVIVQADQPTFANAMEALKKGALGQAVKLGQDELAKKPTASLHGALAIARYGFAIEGFRVDAFAMGGNKKTAADFRNAVVTFLGEMDKVQGHLAAAAKDAKFALELCVACMASEDNYYMMLGAGAFDIERDKTGQELPEGDKRRRPTYRFDHGDLAWGRAFIHFHQAFANIALAYDWSWIDALVGDDDENPKKQKTTKITIKLVEPARIAKAKEHIMAGLAASDEARVAYLAETDDDREWVPSPRQKNFASPLAVDSALYKTWEDIVGDVRRIIGGEQGVKISALFAVIDGSGDDAPPGFLDFGAMLAKPKHIVFDLKMIDRIEAEKNVAKRNKLTVEFMKNILGNGYKATMPSSPVTDRLMQLRKGTGGTDQQFEDKLKYLLWLN